MHGSEVSMRTVSSNTDGILTTGLLYSLPGGVKDQFKNYFRKDATVIFSSCSTGVDGGIAHQLAHLLDVKVIAPDKDTPSPFVKVAFQTGRPVFEVNYPDAEEKIYTPQDLIKIPLLDFTHEPYEENISMPQLIPYIP